MRQFTARAHVRDQWLTASTKDDSSKAELDLYLNTEPGRHFLCENHFSDDSFDESTGSRILKPGAVPMSKVSTIIQEKRFYQTTNIYNKLTIRVLFSEDHANKRLQ